MPDPTQNLAQIIVGMSDTQKDMAQTISTLVATPPGGGITSEVLDAALLPFGAKLDDVLTRLAAIEAKPAPADLSGPLADIGAKLAEIQIQVTPAEPVVPVPVPEPAPTPTPVPVEPDVPVVPPADPSVPGII